MILKSEQEVHLLHSTNDDLIFQRMLTDILINKSFKKEYLNDPKYIFKFKKIAYNGNHIGFTKEEMKHKVFRYKENQTRFNTSEVFIIELIKTT